MSDLIDTTEMYLRTIYELIEDGVLPMRARIAEQLGHSGPTVSQTVARMERDGLVHVMEGDHRLEFTPTGRAIATRVMRKHRLAERLLTDVIGLSLVYVHDEACRWEHVMSDLVEERLLDLLDEPALSPYGNAVPGLAELGTSPSRPTAPSGVVSLEDATSAGMESATVVRIGEPAQATPGVLDLLVAAGLTPGVVVTLSGTESDTGESTLDAGRGAVVVGAAVARHIFVTRA